MNPSVHYDGTLWRCTLRCSDYAMPNGVTIRGPKARASGTQTRNAMVILDPDTWQVAKVHKMEEHDGQTRIMSCANVGYEDMRLFKTDRYGLQGIAASLHLDRGKMDIGRPEGATQNQPPEQVIVSFDGEYNIVHVRPIRGSWWSSKPQKNWAPFDHAESPRFLYAIDRGTMFDEHGAIEGAALVTPSKSRELRPPTPPDPEIQAQRDREQQERENAERAERERADRERAEREEREARERQDIEERKRRERDKVVDRNRRMMVHRGAEVRGMRGRTVATDTLLNRPTFRHGAQPGQKPAPGRRGETMAQSHRVNVATGRALPPRYAGLRGGSQLIHLGDDKWLGIGHEMQFVQSKKYYYHTFFVTDKHGKVIGASDQMKLAKNGIEFAAGMAIDGDRVVISFGVDDMDCKIGETSLSAIMSIIEPVE